MQDPASVPSTFDVVTRVVIPVSTFALGAASSWGLQLFLRRRDTVRTNAQLVASLATDWYNQLSELLKQLSGSDDDGKKIEAVESYLRNRLVFPKLQFSVNVLKQAAGVDHQELVFAAERFLMMVTARDRNNAAAYCTISGLDGRFESPIEGFSSVATIVRRGIKTWSREDSPEFAKALLEQLLPRLDTQLQLIVKEAAKLYK